MMARFRISSTRLRRLAGVLLLAAAPIAAQAGDTGGGTAPGNPQIFPPWQHGDSSDVLDRGFDFTVPEIDSLADFHGSLDHPKLVLYVGGNYYFAMGPLVAAFEKAYPQYAGQVFYVTIPPGMLITAMAHGGRFTSGNMTFTAPPDAYFAGLSKVKAQIAAGQLDAPAIPYVTNDLTIMVQKGNPAHISGLNDLARAGVTVAMPNPAYEGVARQIEASLTKAGGPALANQIYAEGVKSGSTILTRIHHRQTPLWLMQGRVAAGVTWKSEAIFQEQAGNPISDVPIPPEENTTAIYAGAKVHGAAHPRAALDWLTFIRSPPAMRIFESYGFKPYHG